MTSPVPPRRLRAPPARAGVVAAARAAARGGARPPGAPRRAGCLKRLRVSAGHRSWRLSPRRYGGNSWHPPCIAGLCNSRLDFSDRRNGMGQSKALQHLTNERGVAMPMAMMTLVLLTTLMLAFSVLSQTEPVIAANQMRVSQARALAGSRFEY